MFGGLLDGTCHAATNTTPALEWYWHVYTAPASEGAAASNIVETLIVDYTVHFYGLKDLSQADF